MKLTNLSCVREVLARFGKSPDKKFGQNFLISYDTVCDIADMCGAEAEDGIIEIGPGIGTLTAELAQRYKKVVAVEIDKGLLPVLDYTLSEYSNVKIINNDILKTDINGLIREEFPNMKVTVCANLPYYITTPIIMQLLESGAQLEYITVMMQKEVADRLTAAPGKAEYGAITPAVNFYSEPEKILSVSSGCFYPAPKVDSSVLRLKLRRERPVFVVSEKMLFRIIKAAFAERRKTLLNALSSEFSSIPKAELGELLSGIGIEPTVRGERLSLSDFSKIENAFSERLGG